MRGALGTVAVLMATCSPPSAATAEPIGLQPGSYEVEVRLELPHIDDVNARMVQTICVPSTAADGTYGLVVLSGNNPLGKCPSTNRVQDGSVLTFDIVCPGVNQARGRATYTLAPAQFRGRIEMKMGGKNMTMTEVQSGHRIGVCGKTAGAPHS